MCKTSFVSLHKCFNFDKYSLSFYSWLGLMVSVSDLLAKSLKSRIHKKAIGIRLKGHREFIVLLCSSKIWFGTGGQLQTDTK